MALVGPDGRFIQVNRALYDMVGYSEQELLTKTFTDITHPDDIEISRYYLRSLLTGEINSFQMEKRYLHKLGHTIHLLLSTSILRDARGRPMYFVSQFQDFSERKRAEEGLRDSERKFRVLVEGTGAVLCSTDLKGRITYANEPAAGALGVPAENLCGRFYLQFVHPEDRARVHAKFRQQLVRGDPGMYTDFRYVAADGREGWLSFFVNPIWNENRVVGLAGVALDITQRMLAAEELTHSREQLRQLSAHLQSIREEQRTSIAREIHDELGQSLTGLKMDLSWLDKRLPEDLPGLREKTKSMSQLIDATIQSTRRIAAELRPGVLDDLGLWAAIEWQAQEFQHRTGIQCTLISQVEDLNLDKDRSTALFRIFQETLTNVARHANATHVRITLIEQAEAVLLEVKDNGRGIRKAELTDTKSFGLLGIRERALILGGEATISGSPHAGTTVTVKLPRTTSPIL
jgi:PAS domain S-box-containing protein